jgi:hypothetical protein
MRQEPAGPLHRIWRGGRVSELSYSYADGDEPLEFGECGEHGEADAPSLVPTALRVSAAQITAVIGC